MSVKAQLVQRVLRTLEDYDPRTPTFAAARSLLAAAQLSVFLANSDDVLFGRPPDVASPCDGAGRLGMWCLASAPNGSGVLRIVALLVLSAVLAGYRPRWTCLPHCYVSFSFGVNSAVPNGGEHIAEVVTLITLPVCLADNRKWLWSAPARRLNAAWQGRAVAAVLVLRCQMAFVYAEASSAKLTHPAWRDGRAMTAVFLDPVFGAPHVANGVVKFITENPATSTVLGGTVVGIEAFIAGSMLCPFRIRRWGAVAAILLHLGIIVFVGLPTFGFIMIAAVLLAAADGRRQAGRVAPPPETSPVGEALIYEH